VVRGWDDPALIVEASGAVDDLVSCVVAASKGFAGLGGGRSTMVASAITYLAIAVHATRRRVRELSVVPAAQVSDTGTQETTTSDAVVQAAADEHT
jgi:hypothetical protein